MMSFFCFVFFKFLLLIMLLPHFFEWSQEQLRNFCVCAFKTTLFRYYFTLFYPSRFSIFAPHMNKIFALKEWQQRRRRRNEKQYIWKSEERIWNQKRINDKKPKHIHILTYSIFFKKQPKWMVRKRAHELVYNAYICVYMCVCSASFALNSNSFARFFLLYTRCVQMGSRIDCFIREMSARACVWESRFSVFIPCFIFQRFDYILFEFALYFKWQFRIKQQNRKE